MENRANHGPSKIRYQLLKQITNDFDKELILGSGGFGTIYMGVDENHGEIAVMVPHNISGLDDKEFHKEFNNLRGLKHPNIVELVGFCNESEEELALYEGKEVTIEHLRMALCFEYVQNGSLSKHISDENTGFNWPMCYGIIKGICEGLKYLHEGLEFPIMHLDITLDSISLDKDMVPKIGNFSSSRLFGEEDAKKTMNFFATRHVISKEFDIYSLGVIFLELMTGTRLGFPGMDLRYLSSKKIIVLVCAKWREKIQENVKGRLLGGYCQQVKTCLKMAFRCVELDRHKRPAISDIVQTLNETETLIQRLTLLDVHPLLELRFPFMLKVARNEKGTKSSCSLDLKNRGKDRVAFLLVANSPKKYLTKMPLYGVVPPRCRCTLTVTMRKQPPSDSNDFFTLYSVEVDKYDLNDFDGDRDSVMLQYGNFFQKAKEMTGEEVQEVTLKVRFCQQANDNGISSSEIITRSDAQQVSSIDMHPTESWIMTTSRVGALYVRDYNTMTMLIPTEDVTNEPVYTAKFIAREKWLVAGDYRGSIHVYNYEENKGVVSFDAHGCCITTLAVHPTDSFLLSSSSDDDENHLLKLWDWSKNWECTKTFSGHTDRVTHLTFHPEDRDSFASASRDGTVKIWSICSSDPSNISTLRLDRMHGESLMCLDYFTRCNQRHLIVGCKDGTAQIWKLGVKACHDMLEGHGGRISVVSLHPDLPILVTGSLDGSLRIWNSTTYKLENIFNINLGAVYAFGFIKGSTRIVVGCHEGTATMEISLP